MKKIDFRKEMREFYAPSAREFSLVSLPAMQFLQIDGTGDPDLPPYAQALQALYSIAYKLKFASKLGLEKDYVVPPLEAIWWADDMKSFVTGDRGEWKWTTMIMQPEWITPEMFQTARQEAARSKPSPLLESVRLAEFDEGLSVQILHIGPYSEEGPVIERLHSEYLPANGLVENGFHHEIYLSDPRRTEPQKWKTILRQPVRRK